MKLWLALFAALALAGCGGGGSAADETGWNAMFKPALAIKAAKAGGYSVNDYGATGGSPAFKSSGATDHAGSVVIEGPAGDTADTVVFTIDLDGSSGDAKQQFVDHVSAYLARFDLKSPATIEAITAERPAFEQLEVNGTIVPIRVEIAPSAPPARRLNVTFSRPLTGAAAQELRGRNGWAAIFVPQDAIDAAHSANFATDPYLFINKVDLFVSLDRGTTIGDPHARVPNRMAFNALGHSADRMEKIVFNLMLNDPGSAAPARQQYASAVMGALSRFDVKLPPEAIQAIATDKTAHVDLGDAMLDVGPWENLPDGISTAVILTAKGAKPVPSLSDLRKKKWLPPLK